MQFYGGKSEDVHGRTLPQTVKRFGSETFSAAHWDSWLVPTYTASLDAALALTERMLPARMWVITNRGYTGGVYQDGKSSAKIYQKWTEAGEYCSAATPALALLAAMIRALIAADERGED